MENNDALGDAIAGAPVRKPPQAVKVGKVGNVFEQEPIVINAIVTLIVLIGTVWGTDLEPGEVATVVGAVFTIGSFVARQYAVPMARAEAAVSTAFESDPATDAEPVLKCPRGCTRRRTGSAARGHSGVQGTKGGG